MKKIKCYNCEELRHYACDCIKWKHYTNDFIKQHNTVNYNADQKSKYRVQKVTEYDSNKDSDVESLIKNKECLNMLFSIRNNLYD